MTSKRVQYGYEAVITDADGHKKIAVREDLKQMKADAILASLHWYDTEDCIAGVRIIRLYRVSGFPKQDPGDLNVVYRDQIGSAFNGRYYPHTVWTWMKEYWLIAQRKWEFIKDMSSNSHLGRHPIEVTHLEHLARYYTKDSANDDIEASIVIRLKSLRNQEA